MEFEYIRSSILGFDDREKAIRANKDLSPAGQDKQLSLVRQEREDFKQTSLALLERDWRSIKKRYDDLNAKERSAREGAAQVWNFNRLLYENNQVVSWLDRLRDNPVMGQDIMVAVSAHHKDLLNGGDTHQLRAWFETVPHRLRLRLNGDQRLTQAETLIADCEERLAVLLDTPILQAVRKEKAQLAQDAFKLEELTKFCEGTYYDFWSGAGGTTFNSVRQGVQVKWEVDAPTLRDIYTLTVDPEPVVA